MPDYQYFRDRYLYILGMASLAHGIGGAVILSNSNAITSTSPESIWPYCITIMLFSWLMIVGTAETKNEFSTTEATKLRTCREICTAIGIIWGAVLWSNLTGTDMDFLHSQNSYWQLYVYFQITFIYCCVVTGIDLIFEFSFKCSESTSQNVTIVYRV